MARRFRTYGPYGPGGSLQVKCAARPRWLPRCAGRRDDDDPYAPPPAGTFPAPSRRRPHGGRGWGGRVCLAVGRERVGHRAGLLVEEPLRQPGHRCGDRRRQVGHSSETDRTSSGRTAGVRCRTTSRSIAQALSSGLSTGFGRKRLEAHYGGITRIEGAHAVLGASLHLHGLPRRGRPLTARSASAGSHAPPGAAPTRRPVSRSARPWRHRPRRRR